MGETLVEDQQTKPPIFNEEKIYELTKDIHPKIRNLDKSLISDTLKFLRVPYNDSEIDSYLKTIISLGIKAFIARLTRSDIQDISNLFKFEKDNQRYLSNYIFRNGISQFVSNISDRNILINIRKRLFLEDEINDSSELSIDEIKKGIVDEIISIGFASLLDSLNDILLKRYCKELKIDDNGSKNDIVNRIMDETFELISYIEYTNILEHNKKRANKSKKRKNNNNNDGTTNKKSKTFDTYDSDDSPNEKHKKSRNSNGSDDDEEDGKSRTRVKHVSPPLENIKKGITGQDLHNLYNFKDLQMWCKQQNLNYIGKKGVLIKRILNYFETGEVQDKKKGKKV